MTCTQPREEHLIRECLERIHLAFRTKDEELWRESQHPPSLEWLSQHNEGLYLEFLIASQVHDNNFPSTAWKSLREFSAQDEEKNKFLNGIPTHVLEYRVIPYSEVRKPLAEQQSVERLEFAFVDEHRAWMVSRLPSGEDLEFARGFLEKQKASGEKVDLLCSQMEAEVRDELLVFQIQRKKIEAIKYVVAELQTNLSEAKQIVERVWASRPLAQ